MLCPTRCVAQAAPFGLCKAPTVNCVLCRGMSVDACVRVHSMVRMAEHAEAASRAPEYSHTGATVVCHVVTCHVSRVPVCLSDPSMPCNGLYVSLLRPQIPTDDGSQCGRSACFVASVQACRGLTLLPDLVRLYGTCKPG